MATVVRRSERHNARSVIVELCPVRREKAVKIAHKPITPSTRLMLACIELVKMLRADLLPFPLCVRCVLCARLLLRVFLRLLCPWPMKLKGEMGRSLLFAAINTFHLSLFTFRSAANDARTPSSYDVLFSGPNRFVSALSSRKIGCVHR